MYLSDRDLAWAIKNGTLVFEPRPEIIDPTSIDLHLDSIKEAKIWNIEKFAGREKTAGRGRPQLHIGTYDYRDFSDDYMMVPPEDDGDETKLVVRHGNEIIVRPQGFLLWQTKEEVGTKKDNAQFICFINGKSTKARAGIVVHLTAPNVHAAWEGKLTLEIVNLGPFDLVLKAGDVIAQLTVAKVTSPPERDVSAISQTYGQLTVHGAEKATPSSTRRSKTAKRRAPR
jgi:dCTP deaminase